jgi:hypothetical protein
MPGSHGESVKRLGHFILVAAVVLVGIQFIPMDQTNPPVLAEVEASANVKRVIERSCYDCHSNETRWPWYSQVAPLSWLITSDVNEGREHLNFSTWGRLSTEDRVEKMEEIGEEVEEWEMPLWFYLPLHPEARLSAKDRDLLLEWSRNASPEEHS